MRQSLLAFASAAAIAVGGVGTARAALVLSGPDSNAGSYTVAALASDTTSADSVTSGGLSGISLWGLLGGAAASSSTSSTWGDITTSTPTGDNAKNSILRYYLVATSSTGAQSVVSLGEIDPTFGSTSAFLATTSGGAALSSPELVVAGDASRDLSNVVSLQLLSVPALAPTTSLPSTSLTLSGNTANAGTYTGAQLASDFTPVTETVSGDTYTGVPLAKLIAPTASSVASQIVTVGATDGYEVVYAAAELLDNTSDILPYADTGGNFPGDGVARKITPGDNAHGRWVSNIDSIVVSNVPEPSSAAIFAAAFLSLGLFRRGRNRTAK